MKSKVSPLQKSLNVWAIILIIWAIYRAKFRLPEWFDEFIAKPIVFILPVFYYIRKVEKKDFFSSIYLKLKMPLQDVVLTIAIGAMFVISAVIANFFKYKGLVFFRHSFTFENLVMMVLIALATGISEEILSRGFVLKRLYDESKNMYTSTFFASILFFFLHVPILFTNLKISGNLLLMFLATDLILSFLNSVIFIERKNLLVPILIHTFYNLSIILFL